MESPPSYTLLSPLGHIRATTLTPGFVPSTVKGNPNHCVTPATLNSLDYHFADKHVDCPGQVLVGRRDFILVELTVGLAIRQGYAPLYSVAGASWIKPSLGPDPVECSQHIGQVAYIRGLMPDQENWRG